MRRIAISLSGLSAIAFAGLMTATSAFAVRVGPINGGGSATLLTPAPAPWLVGELAFWAQKLRIGWDWSKRPAEPFAFYLDGYPAKARPLWNALGCAYEEAQALADSHDEAQVRQAPARGPTPRHS